MKNQRKQIATDFIVVRAMSGGEVHQCIIESAIRSLEEQVPVRLLHNGREITINPECLLEVVYKSNSCLSEK